MRKTSDFFAASALLAAVLVIWVVFFAESGPIGRAWCYSATLILLVAMGSAAWRSLRSGDDRVPDEASGLFLAGLSMTVIAVAESLVLAAYNCWLWLKYGTSGDPVHSLIPEAHAPRLHMVAGPAACAVFLILGFFLMSRVQFKSSSGWFRVGLVCLAIAVVALFYVFGLVVFERAFR